METAVPTPLLSPRNAAALLGVSTKHLLDMSKHGVIAFIDVGLCSRPTRRYRMEDIEAFIAERRTLALSRSSAPPAQKVTGHAAYQVVDFRKTLEQLRADKKAAKVKRTHGR